jgi:hypothetical protein
MPALEHGFFFDPNFALGSESVFTLADRVEIPPLPPIEGFFLLLDGTDFLLLDGENLALL